MSQSSSMADEEGGVDGALEEAIGSILADGGEEELPHPVAAQGGDGGNGGGVGVGGWGKSSGRALDWPDEDVSKMGDMWRGGYVGRGAPEEQ